MRVEDCYQLGYISKTHGLHGEVQVFLDVDFPEDYRNLESVFVLQGKTLVPFFISHLHLKGTKAITKFEDIDTIDQASELVSSELYLPLNALPELPDGKYYYHQLIGFQLFDEETLIGTVTGVYNMTAQNLLAVDYQGQEVLVPMSDEILVQVDTKQEKILASLPDGLLELYTEDDED